MKTYLTMADITNMLLAAGYLQHSVDPPNLVRQWRKYGQLPKPSAYAGIDTQRPLWTKSTIDRWIEAMPEPKTKTG